MKTIIKYMSIIFMWLAIIAVASELPVCENLTLFIIVKVGGLLVMYISGKVLEKTMSDEELNEKV